MLRFFELLLDFSGERALCVLVKPYKKIPPWLEIELVTPFKVLCIERKQIGPFDFSQRRPLPNSFFGNALDFSGEFALCV